MGEQRGIEGSGRLGGSRPRARSRAALGCALATALCLVLAPTAEAGKKNGTVAMFFDVQAGNGYSMVVQAQREAGRRARAEVTLVENDRSVVYVKSRGVRLTRNEIGFRLGSLGSVEMAFESERRFDQGRCEGAGIRRGKLRGRLHFRGEDSYARAHASKARAYVQVGADDRCSLLSHRKPRKPRPEATLTSCGPGPKLSFVTSAEEFFGFTISISTLQERVDGIDIYRTAASFDQGGDFSFDEKNYRSAKVRPAWPFAGTGSYRDGELTGDLTVSFPGRDDVPLTTSDRAKLRKAVVPGRSCGIDRESIFGGYYSAPVGSAPEDPAAVGFDRR